jgi:hypothetical protein
MYVCVCACVRRRRGRGRGRERGKEGGVRLLTFLALLYFWSKAKD